MSNTDNQNPRSTSLFYFKMENANTMLGEPQSIERQILQSSTTARHQSPESDDDESILHPPKKKKGSIF